MTKKDPGFDSLSLPDPLPDSLFTCHKLIVKFWHRILELEKQVRRRNRTIHGPTSARVDIDEIKGEGKEICDETSLAIEAERTKLGIAQPSEHGGGGRKAPHAAKEETIERHKIFEAATLLCPCCNITRTQIGFTVSYQLDYVSARYRKIKHVEYSYAPTAVRSARNKLSLPPNHSNQLIRATLLLL